MSILKGIPFLRQELTKIFMKRAADKSGIMTVPFKNKKLQLDIEDRLQKYILDAQKQGVDLDMVSNENLKYTIKLNENVDPISRAISADSPEGRRITEMLLGKRGEVVDMTGKKLDTSQGIMGGKSVKELMESGQVQKGTERLKKSKKVQDREMFENSNLNKTDAQIKAEIEASNKKSLSKMETNNFSLNTITKIKSMKPMDAMKEANLVAGKKGRYANLDDNQVKKIIDDTTDHIFERDIPIDPEDMADGGVAGLLGERPGYNKGLKVQGSGSISGKNQIQGAPEGITSNKSFINLIANLDIPISEKINLLGDVQYSKFRDKIEKGDEELFIEDPGSFLNKKIGVGINQGNEGFSGSAKYDVDSGEPEFKILFKKSFAQGGPARQNFKMGKRAFLKLMGGVGAGITGLKSGIFGFGKGGAKKAVTETVKQTAGSGTPPPYFLNLVKKIKTLGDDTIATKDKAIAKKYKDYTMEEDFAGNIEIIKKGDDVAEDVFMSYKIDDVPVKGKKGSTKVEEYEEFTARPDREGKMKDIEQGVPDEVVQEGTVFEDTLSEFGKASGGRIGFYEGGDYNRSKMKELADAFARQKYGRTLTDLPDVKRFEMEDLAIKSLSKDIEKKADGGRIGYSKGKFVKGIISLFKKKPKKLETVEEFLEKRQFMKDIVGNTEKNKKARQLAEILEAADKARKNPGFKFKDVNIDKDIRPILDRGLAEALKKNRKLNATGGLANMLGE